MQRLEVSSAVRPLYGSLGVKGLRVKECGPDSVVGIPTVYGQDGPGFEFQCGRDFPHLFRPAQWPTQPLIKWSFQVVQRPACGVEHPPSSSAEVRERVQLYLYSPLWAFVACSS